VGLERLAEYFLCGGLEGVVIGPTFGGDGDQFVCGRNGNPFAASRSATPVAVEKPSPASAARVSSFQSAVATAPAATSLASVTASTVSHACGVARWRSRLYARGKPFSVVVSPWTPPAASPATARTSSSVSGFFSGA